MTRFACISDLHGFLPQVPDCDVLLLGGDYSPNRDTEENWLRTQFAPWLRSIDDRGIQIVGVAGNHDIHFERHPPLIPAMRWAYLQDSSTNCCGLEIYGSPWQQEFGIDWAFNATEAELEKRWAAIPDDTDVLLLHGPPHGYSDYSVYSNVHTGSPSLTKRIHEVQPKLAVCGHIHSGNGVYRIGQTTLVNAAIMNEAYQPVQDIHVIEIRA